MDSTREVLANQIRELLESDRVDDLRRVLREAHPADIADAVDVLSEDDRLRVFSLLDDQIAGEVLDETEPEATTALLKDLDSERTADILEEMPSNDAVEILSDLPEDEAERLLGLMEKDEAEDVQELLQYPENSAGRIMSEEVISLKAEMTAGEAIQMLRRIAPRAETAYYLYVTDASDRLVGVVSLRDLIVADTDVKIGEIMDDKVISVTTTTDQEEVARIVSKYDFVAVPVVDESDKLVGVITVDDIIDVIEEEASEDIYALGGTTEDPEAVRSPLPSAIRRLPWLLITVIGEIFTALVISGYEVTLEQVLALVFFVPVIMATGGNVGTQSLAMMVRSIALEEQAGRSVKQVILREGATGILLGVMIGIFTAIIASIWMHMLSLGLVIAIAMTLTLTFSAMLGALIPLIFRSLGKDPALASGPFITTLNDIVSVTIYFILATQLLHLIRPTTG